MALSNESISVGVKVDSKNAQKSLKQLASELKNTEENLKLTTEATKINQAEIEKNTQAVALLESQYNSTNTTLKQFSLGQSQIGNELTTVSNSFTAVASSVSAAIDAFQAFTSPEVLTKLSKIARVAALFADVKGFDKTADALRRVSIETQNFAVSNKLTEDSINNSIDRYAQLDRTIEATKDGVSAFTVSTLALAAVPFAGVLVEQGKATKDLGVALFNAKGNFSAVTKEASAFMGALGSFKTAGVSAAELFMGKFALIKNVLSSVGKDFYTLTGQIIQNANIFKSFSKLGFLSVAEASIASGTALGALGYLMVNMNSTIANVTGTLLILASILTGVFGFAVNMALGFLGNLAVSIGNTLIESMTAFEEKALKLQSVMSAFTFTISGFNKVYGEEAVGSLEKWQAALEETVATTTFSREETAKAIKLLVAEGKTLGLSVENTTDLLEKSKDVAASTGLELNDVVQRMIAGLAGNSQAVLTLGINTSETALNQLELVKSTGKAVSALSDQDKIMARLQEIFVATKPIAGAAAVAVGTVAGSYKQLEKSLDSVKAKLGEQGKFTQAYLTVFNKIATAFLSLPDSVFSTIGTLQDFLGVSLKIIGVILQYVLMISSLVAAYGLLTVAIAKYQIVQAFLTGGFSLLGSAMGATTVAVTSMSAVFVNLGILLKAGVASALTVAWTSLIAFGKGLLTVTASAIPFLLPLAGIATALYGVYQGFKIVNEDTKIFTNFAKNIQQSWEFISGSTRKAGAEVLTFGKIFSNITNLIVATGTIIVSSFVSVIQQIASVMFKAAKMVTFFSQHLQNIFGGAIEEAEENIKNLSETTARSLAVVFELGSSSAFASGKLNDGANSAERFSVSLSKVANSTERVTQLTREMGIAQAQGNNESALALEKQILILKITTEKEAEEKIKLVDQFVSNSANIQNVFNDAVKASNKAALEARKQVLEGLKDSGSVKELIAVRKQLEGQEIKDKIIKFQVLADESGAKEAINALQKQLSVLENQIESTEWKKFNEAFAENTINKSTKALQGLADVVKNLSENLEKAQNEFNLFSKAKNQNESELDFSATLKAIDLQRKKSIEMGADLKIVEEQAAKATQLAIAIYEQKDALEIIKAIKEEILAAEKLSKDNLENIRIETLKGNEELLRAGMTRFELIERELQVELDKLEAIEAQVKAAGKLDSVAERGLELAKATVEAQTSVKLKDAQGSQFTDSARQLVAPVAEGNVSGFMSAADTIVSAVQKLIDFIPNILNSIAKVFTSLSELPLMILSAVKNVTSSVVKIISDLVPNLFKAIPDIIDDILNAIFVAIPNAIQKLFESMPKLIDGLLQRVPDLVSKFVSGILSNVTVIALNIVSALIKNFPAFFKAFILFAPRLAVQIAIGIVKGIRDAIFGIGDAIAESFSGGITLGVTKASDALSSLGSGIGDQLFKVADLTAETKAGEKAAALGESIKQAGISAANFFSKTWDKIIQALKFVWQAIIAGFMFAVNALKSAFDFIFEMFTTIFEFGKSVFTAVFNYAKSIFEGIVVIFKAVFEFVKSIFVGIIDGFQAVWNFVSTLFDNPIQAFKNLWTDLSNIFSNVFSKFAGIGTAIWDSVKNAFSASGNFFADIGKTIWGGVVSAFNAAGNLLKNLFKFDGGGKGAVENFLNFDFPFLAFAKGGTVPGTPNVFGDSSRNDTVPALLSPGEAVIPRSLMNDPAVSKLISGILSGKKVGQHAKGFWEKAGDAFSSVTSFVVPDWIENLYNSVKRFISGIDLTKLVTDPSGFLTDSIKNSIGQFKQFFEMMLPRFAEGGIVGGSGSTDSIRAMLTPGEFVLNKQATNSIGHGALTKMNATGSIPQGDTNISVNIVLNSSGQIDSNYVRDKLMPQIKDELKKESRRGGYIIAAAGVRS